MLDELNSRTLLDERCGYIILMGGGICDNGFDGIEDAKFLWEVSARHGKSKLRMQNF